MKIVMICCQVSAEPKILTSLPLSSCGKESEDVPQINAAADSRIIATPRVLTNHAKLSRLTRNTGRTAKK